MATPRISVTNPAFRPMGVAQRLTAGGPVQNRLQRQYQGQLNPGAVAQRLTSGGALQNQLQRQIQGDFNREVRNQFDRQLDRHFDRRFDDRFDGRRHGRGHDRFRDFGVTSYGDLYPYAYYGSYPYSYGGYPYSTYPYADYGYDYSNDYPSDYYGQDYQEPAYVTPTANSLTANVQVQLKRAGYYTGPVDGVLGLQTRAAISAFSVDRGLSSSSTGNITTPLLRWLRLL